MKKKEVKIYKKRTYIEVFQYFYDPKHIYKKYTYDGYYYTKEDIKELKKRLLHIKECEFWPDFVIKPISLECLNSKSFVTQYPFVEGITLENYLLSNDIDLLTCAKFISSLEKKLMSFPDFVFPDIANTSNIIILPNGKEQLQFLIIDPDDIQFNGFNSKCLAGLVAPVYDRAEDVRGMKKCINGEFYTKELDIRSMYALFYGLINGRDYFYPIMSERKDLNEYIEVLKMLNIPIGSMLYEKTLNTISDTKPNELISDALFELIDSGYDFETYGKCINGYQHKLIKK